MMKIMGRRYSRRGVSVVIAALLLIAISVAAAVLLYVFSIGLLGSLASSGGQQTKQQVILEAYNWGNTGSLVLNLRNVGSATVNLASASYYVNGTARTGAPGTCTASQAPQTGCTVTLLISPAGSSGVAYVVKIVTPDGAVFSYSAIAGQSS